MTASHETRHGSLSPASQGAAEPAGVRGIGPRWKVFALALAIAVSASAGLLKLQFPLFEIAPIAVAALATAAGIVLLPLSGLRSNIAVPIWLFFFLSLLGFVIAAFTTSMEFAVRGLVGLLTPVATAVLVSTWIRREESDVGRRMTFVLSGVIVVALTVNAMWALRQSLVGFSADELASYRSGPSTFSVNEVVRSSGMFSINQEFGMVAGCLAAATLVMALSFHRWRPALLLCYGLTVSALVLHLGRTPLAVALLCSFIALLMFAPLRSRLVAVILSSIGAAISVVVAFALLTASTDARARESLARVTSLFSSASDVSVVARTDVVWERAITLIVDHPFGLGAGAAGPTSSTFPDLAPAGAVVTDQGYLLIGVQLGWAGMAVFVWMLIVFLVGLLRSRAGIARAAGIALLGLMLCMVWLQYWSLPAPGFIIGVLMGIGMSAAPMFYRYGASQPSGRRRSTEAWKS